MRKTCALLAATPSSQRSTQSAILELCKASAASSATHFWHFALFLYGTATYIAFAHCTWRGESVLRCVDVGAEAVHCADIRHSLLCVPAPLNVDFGAALLRFMASDSDGVGAATFAVGAHSLESSKHMRIQNEHGDDKLSTLVTLRRAVFG